MQRLSDIIANSPVLASQASVSMQQPLNEGAGVSSTPKSTSMQASFRMMGILAKQNILLWCHLGMNPSCNSWLRTGSH